MMLSWFYRIYKVIVIVNKKIAVMPDLARILDLAPVVASFPLTLIPASLRNIGLTGCLNRAFAEQLDDGELDFLEGKSLQIQVTDVSWHCSFTLEQSRLVIASGEPDCVFSGKLADFVLLAARRQDPDTLFFQRRLMIEGDTELGLGVKNFLFSVESDDQFPLLFLTLEKLADIVEVVESARQSLLSAPEPPDQ